MPLKTSYTKKVKMPLKRLRFDRKLGLNIKREYKNSGIPIFATTRSIKMNTVWDDVQNKPLVYPPDEHTHSWDDIQDKPVLEWDDIQNKPLVYPPDGHTHEVNWDDIQNKPLVYPPDGHTHEVNWDDIQNKPLVYPPDGHTHEVNWDDIQDKPDVLRILLHVLSGGKPGQFLAKTHYGFKWEDIKQEVHYYNYTVLGSVQEQELPDGTYLVDKDTTYLVDANGNYITL